MEEGDPAAANPDPRRLVDQPDPLLLEPGERRVDVADVVDRVEHAGLSLWSAGLRAGGAGPGSPSRRFWWPPGCPRPALGEAGSGGAGAVPPAAASSPSPRATRCRSGS